MLVLQNSHSFAWPRLNDGHFGIITSTLFLSIFIASCSGSGNGGFGKSEVDLSTAQSTLESMFRAFQANDTATFMSMVATPDDFRSHYEAENALKTNDKRPPEELEKDIQRSIEYLDRPRIQKRLINAYNKGLADGIVDWKDVTFSRASGEYVDELNQSNNRIFFTYKENTGALRIGYLIKATRGWVLGSAQFGALGGGTPEYDKMIPSSMFIR
ncbi:MAG: hypothetical protein EBR30_30065 [Cytophagia bacterium]|nr:hypothetical protein [Cytophagia bacterium]